MCNTSSSQVGIKSCRGTRECVSFVHVHMFVTTHYREVINSINSYTSYYQYIRQSLLLATSYLNSIYQRCNRVTSIDLGDSLTHWLRPSDLDIANDPDVTHKTVTSIIYDCYIRKYYKYWSI